MIRSESAHLSFPHFPLLHTNYNYCLWFFPPHFTILFLSAPCILPEALGMFNSIYFHINRMRTIIWPLCHFSSFLFLFYPLLKNIWEIERMLKKNSKKWSRCSEKKINITHRPSQNFCKRKCPKDCQWIQIRILFGIREHQDVSKHETEEQLNFKDCPGNQD